MRVQTADSEIREKRGKALQAGETHRLLLRNSLDTIVARATARKLADAVGYSLTDQARLSAAVFEVTRDIISYAGLGEVIISWYEEDEQHKGLQFHCSDCGLESPELAAVLYPHHNGTEPPLNQLILKKLVDEVKITRDSTHGNCITLIKWMG